MEAKPFASLTSGLLARKGQAKPAMRPQGFGGGFNMGSSTSRDDLGWNDMGYDVQRPASVAEPSPVSLVPPPVSSPPPVVIQREELAQELGIVPEPVEPPAPVLTAAPRAKAAKAVKRPAIDAAAAHRKAAFTLRLDADRHLKLRLATAVRNRSAQQLVTEALDRYLAEMNELDDLAGCVPARGNA